MMRLDMDETKACPWCGETILAVAKKCKHCGEYFQEQTQTVAWVPDAEYGGYVCAAHGYAACKACWDALGAPPDGRHRPRSCWDSRPWPVRRSGSSVRCVGSGTAEAEGLRRRISGDPGGMFYGAT